MFIFFFNIIFYFENYNIHTTKLIITFIFIFIITIYYSNSITNYTIPHKQKINKYIKFYKLFFVKRKRELSKFLILYSTTIFLEIILLDHI